MAEAIEQPEDAASQQNAATIRAQALEEQMYNMSSQQNFTRGLVLGIAAALAGAVLWAVITVTTKYQVGYMAVGVGLLVGLAIRLGGKGIEPKFGVAGAALALGGCVLGNFLSVVGFIAIDQEQSFLETLVNMDFSLVPGLMTESFQPMDLLFYGIAVYEGYRFSFHQID
jgi:uncharacterized ion transporter superfamily protein YfcC